jgi:glycosyltransferase involved in cell wall biosynthesis
MTADAVGGVWTYALELARGLGRRGIEVVLATMGAPLTPDQQRAAAHVANLELVESRYKLEWMQDPWEDLEQSGEWLLELRDRFEPDVVHLNGYAHGTLPWDTPVLVAGHSCVLFWWAAVKGEKAPDSWRRYKETVENGLHAADLVVAPSRVMLASLIREYGPFAATKVIPNGRRMDLYRPFQKEPFILSVGRIRDEAKNIAALEKLAPDLAWPVYVAGESEHPEKGDTSWNNVRLLGKLPEEELAPWFGRAAVYSLPARYEPFGFTPLEAAMAGCALVLGDIPSLRETWSDGAIFVSPDDNQGLAQNLNRLAGDEEYCKTLAAKALLRARNFTSEQMVSHYIDAYRSIAD